MTCKLVLHTTYPQQPIDPVIKRNQPEYSSLVSPPGGSLTNEHANRLSNSD